MGGIFGIHFELTTCDFSFSKRLNLFVPGYVEFDIKHLRQRPFDIEKAMILDPVLLISRAAV